MIAPQHGQPFALFDRLGQRLQILLAEGGGIDVPDDKSVVAVRGDEDPVVVELKERLTLALILQAVDRLSLSDTVYLAFRIGKGHSATWRSRRKQVVRLLRRLGLGLLTVSTRGNVGLRPS